VTIQSPARFTEERIEFGYLFKDPLFLRFALEDAPADTTAEDILAICQRFGLRDVKLEIMEGARQTNID